MFRLILGESLRIRRRKLALTQKDVAARAGVSLKYLGEIERGEANVTVEVLQTLAKVLEWDPWRLFSVTPQPISEELHRFLSQELHSLAQRLEALIALMGTVEPARRATEEAGPLLDGAREESLDEEGGGLASTPPSSEQAIGPCLVRRLVYGRAVDTVPPFVLHTRRGRGRPRNDEDLRPPRPSQV